MDPRPGRRYTARRWPKGGPWEAVDSRTASARGQKSPTGPKAAESVQCAMCKNFPKPPPPPPPPKTPAPSPCANIHKNQISYQSGTALLGHQQRMKINAGNAEASSCRRLLAYSTHRACCPLKRYFQSSPTRPFGPPTYHEKGGILILDRPGEGRFTVVPLRPQSSLTWHLLGHPILLLRALAGSTHSRFHPFAWVSPAGPTYFHSSPSRLCGATNSQ